MLAVWGCNSELHFLQGFPAPPGSQSLFFHPMTLACRGLQRCISREGVSVKCECPSPSVGQQRPHRDNTNLHFFISPDDKVLVNPFINNSAFTNIFMCYYQTGQEMPVGKGTEIGQRGAGKKQEPYPRCQGCNHLPCLVMEAMWW